MILGENIGSVYSAGKEIQRVYSRGKLVWEKKTNDDIDYSEMPFTVQAVENASISLKDIDSNAIKFNYSLNGGEWKTATTISIKKNDIISIKANNAAYCKITGLSDIYGNIMSLLYGDNYKNQTVWLKELRYESYADGYFLRSDIRNAHNLILPATTLAVDCYRNMFRDCTSLTTAPELPATTLAPYCYNSMFSYCTSLTTAPELPATTLGGSCYNYMFKGCTSLYYIKCYVTKNIKYSVTDWTDGISTNGKLVCYEESADIFRNYIPDTWTVEYITE